MKKEKVNESVEFKDVFTPEELKTLNFTEEELEILNGSYILSETAKILPEDDNAFIKKVEKTFDGLSDDEIKAKAKELAEKDPEFAKQIVTLYSLYALGVDEEAPTATVEKVDLNQIKTLKEDDEKKKNQEMMDGIIAKLKG